jgi:RNA polymerase sigma-70 factor, ECF subfamily
MAAIIEDQDRTDMARLMAGHDAALDDLMARHGERLYHFLLRLLQNETEAADLAEEAFVRVYQHRAQFKVGGKFSTWLYTIATNLVRDVKRRQARHPHVSLNAVRDDTEVEYLELLEDAKPDPGERLESLERAGIVKSAIAALADDLRAPLILSVYEGKSHAEIGEILDCSAKAVEMRLYRARQELRGQLEKVLGAA